MVATASAAATGYAGGRCGTPHLILTVTNNTDTGRKRYSAGWTRHVLAWRNWVFETIRLLRLFRCAPRYPRRCGQCLISSMMRFASTSPAIPLQEAVGMRALACANKAQARPRTILALKAWRQRVAPASRPMLAIRAKTQARQTDLLASLEFCLSLPPAGFRIALQWQWHQKTNQTLAQVQPEPDPVVLRRDRSARTRMTAKINAHRVVFCRSIQAGCLESRQNEVASAAPVTLHTVSPDGHAQASYRFSVHRANPVRPSMSRLAPSRPARASRSSSA